MMNAVIAERGADAVLVPLLVREGELEQAHGDVDIVINASSAGMRPGDPVPIDPGVLRPETIVSDIIVGTRRTPLLDAAERSAASPRTETRCSPGRCDRWRTSCSETPGQRSDDDGEDSGDRRRARCARHRA
jgi:hypothetical protein